MTEILEEIIPEKKTRAFGGKTDNFESKEERRFEQKHLKAYLKGNRLFRHGYIKNTIGFKEPMFFKVLEIWK